VLTVQGFAAFKGVNFNAGGVDNGGQITVTAKPD